MAEAGFWSALLRYFLLCALAGVKWSPAGATPFGWTKVLVVWLALEAQDVFYLALLLIVSPDALFLFTGIAARLFCGYPRSP